MSRCAEITKYLWEGDDGPDEITSMAFKSWDELFGMDSHTVEAFQVDAANRRLTSLVPYVRALQHQSETSGITNIGSLSDIVPLLFQHSLYKSYPVSLVEKKKFSHLTRWLDGLTSIDLSGIDTSQCGGLDDWLGCLEQDSILRPLHTSGTSGKFSFLPRATYETDMQMYMLLKDFEGYGDEPGVYLAFDQVRLPCIYPSKRYGRYTAQRGVSFLERFLAPSPEQCYTLSNGTLSPDVVSLSGRVRIAQSKGELEKLTLADNEKIAFKNYLDELERQPQETDAFMASMMSELKGQSVYCVSQTAYLAKAAEEGLKRGVKQAFSPDSIGTFGGGNKGAELADNYREQIAEFTGIERWKICYGMSELIGSMPLCSEGYFHIPPYTIPFLLDPDTGAELPREGTQTGRFAFLDLLPDSYWGGFITGDKVTVDWDRECGCGRKGAHIHDTITRFSESVTGDDKVVCSATIDNTDSALQALLAV